MYLKEPSENGKSGETCEFKCAPQPTHNSDSREWRPHWFEVSEHNFRPNHWLTNKVCKCREELRQALIFLENKAKWNWAEISMAVHFGQSEFCNFEGSKGQLKQKTIITRIKQNLKLLNRLFFYVCFSIKKVLYKQ